MQAYQCHKIVHAEAMTRGDYNEFKQSIGAQSSGIMKGRESDEGYHVVYSKGTPEEYHSWSPKKAFDEGYELLP